MISPLADHAQHPRNRRILDNADVTAHGANPMCADTLDVFVRFSPEDLIDEVTFEGRGCAVCLASASCMTENVKGKSIAEVATFALHDVEQWLGTSVGRMREGCALLGLEVLKRAMMTIKRLNG